MHLSHHLYSANGIRRFRGSLEQKFYRKTTRSNPMVDVAEVGILLIIVGIGVLVAAIVFSGTRRTEVKGGGVVLIGPIPIIFGSDAKWATVAIVLALVLVVLSLLLWVL